MPAGKKGKTRKKERKVIPSGRAFIQSSFNNTVVTLTDPEGNVLSWGSSGTAGFKVEKRYSLCCSIGGFGCRKKGGELRLAPGGCIRERSRQRA